MADFKDCAETTKTSPEVHAADTGDDSWGCGSGAGLVGFTGLGVGDVEPYHFTINKPKVKSDVFSVSTDS